LRWKNLANGAEGVSILHPVSGGATGRALYVWEVPSDACANAGWVEVSISFYDKEEDRLAFSWNTASYSDLKVEKTMSSVGINMPALDDILLIDEETRSIIAPAGYNNTICNYGDIGVAEIYFLVNSYLGKNHGLNVLDKDCTVSICVKMNGMTEIEADNITVVPYSAEIVGRKNEGMALITWHIPSGITAGKGGPNNLEISIGFKQNGQRWYSNSYNKLNVGHSLFEYKGEELEEEWGLTENFVKEIIEDYFESGLTVFDPN
jgi:hypothetical protein